MWLLVNHTKLTSTLLKLVSFNSGQLQISERAITKQRGITNDTVNGATLIAINRVIKVHTCEHGQIIPYC